MAVQLIRRDRSLLFRQNLIRKPSIYGVDLGVELLVVDLCLVRTGGVRAQPIVVERVKSQFFAIMQPSS